MEILKNKFTAEIVGLCFGDGSFTRRHSGKNKGRLRFQLRGDVNEDREHYDSFVKPLFDSQLEKVNFTHYKGKNAYYGIYSEKKELCNSLVDLEIPVGVKDELEIPLWIMKNNEFSSSFLRGFFDTDGTITCGKDYNNLKRKHVKIRVGLISTSKKLIFDSSYLLNKLNIHNLIISSYKPKDSSHKEFWKLIVDGPNVKDFFEIVGSNNLKHITKLKVWKKFGFCPPRTTLEQRKLILSGYMEPKHFYTSYSYF